MKRINNIIVTLLVSFAIATSASAGALSVSGSAKATYGTMSGNGANGDNTLGVANELVFGASGELDNGWTWKYQTEIDPGATAGTANADAVTDDSNLNITSPYGTVAICISECGLSAALNFSADAYTLMSDTAYGEGKVEPRNISSFANMQYHTPAGLLPFGIVGKIAYAPSGNNTVNSTNAGSNSTKSTTIGNTTMYRIESAPIDGLALNISYSESDGADVAGLTDEQKDEGGAIAGKYANGPFTIGVGRAYSSLRLADDAGDVAESYINTNYSLGYSIGDNMSVSYTKEKSVQDKATAATVTYDQTTSSVQAAYTMGGMTLAIARADYDNVAYANNVDAVETIFAVTMAF